MARVKRGPKAIKVQADRCKPYKKRIIFFVRGTSAECLPLQEGANATLTSTELDEMANNNYGTQFFQELNRDNKTSVRDWLVIGLLGFLVILQFYSFNELNGGIEQLYYSLFPPTPPAPPVR